MDVGGPSTTSPSAACGIAGPASAVLTATLHVPGMRCMGNCGGKVKRALAAVPGVDGMCGTQYALAWHAGKRGTGWSWLWLRVLPASDVSIDLDAKTVTVTCDSDLVDVAELAPAVTAAGYDATLVGGAGGSVGATAAAPATTMAVLSVPGMMCMGSCGSKVKKALGTVAGVKGECVQVTRSFILMCADLSPMS